MYSDFFLVYLFFYFLTYKNLWKLLLTDLNHSKQSVFAVLLQENNFFAGATETLGQFAFYHK